MLLAVFSVTGVTFYFFYLVLRTPPKKEIDSYSENDDEIIRQAD
jgi:hypothetical protein